MLIKVKKNKCIAYCIFLACSILAYLLIYLFRGGPFVEWTRVFTIVTVSLLIVQLFLFSILEIRIISIFPLISIMSYLFQFGDTYCYALGFEVERMNGRILYYTSYEEYINGSMFALSSIIFFTLAGALLKLKYTCEYSNKDICADNTKVRVYKYIGIIIILISAPFWIYALWYMRTTILLGGNYTVLAEAALPGYITSLGNFIYVGLFSLILYFNRIRNKKIEYFCILLLFLCLLMVMVLGSRSTPMTIFFAFLIFYTHCTNFRLTPKRVIICILAVVILANLLYAIQIGRNSGYDISNVIEIFADGGFHVILDEVFEFGTTIFSTVTVHSQIHEFHPTWFILKEIFAITPIPIQNEYTVVGSVMAGVAELGTSYIGEMYYYFGKYYWVGCSLIAVYIVMIENYLETQVKNGKYFVYLMFMMWTWQQLNCIRATFNLGIKTIIYSFVLFETVKFITIVLSKNNKVLK